MLLIVVLKMEFTDDDKLVKLVRDVENNSLDNDLNENHHQSCVEVCLLFRS